MHVHHSVSHTHKTFSAARLILAFQRPDWPKNNIPDFTIHKSNRLRPIEKNDSEPNNNYFDDRRRRHSKHR